MLISKNNQEKQSKIENKKLKKNKRDVDKRIEMKKNREMAP